MKKQVTLVLVAKGKWTAKSAYSLALWHSIAGPEMHQENPSSQHHVLEAKFTFSFLWNRAARLWVLGSPFCDCNLESFIGCGYKRSKLWACWVSAVSSDGAVSPHAKMRTHTWTDAVKCATFFLMYISTHFLKAPIIYIVHFFCTKITTKFLKYFVYDIDLLCKHMCTYMQGGVRENENCYRYKLHYALVFLQGVLIQAKVDQI